MFGSIQYENFKGLTTMPQKAASAWGKVDELVGASYKPLLYVGEQITRGVNYIFIAEQEIICRNSFKHLALVIINEFNGEYEIADIETIL